MINGCRSEDEFRLKQSTKRKEPKDAADKKEEDLRKSQGPLKKAAVLKAKSDARTRPSTTRFRARLARRRRVRRMPPLAGGLGLRRRLP
jgi:hypothetical protein